MAQMLLKRLVGLILIVLAITFVTFILGYIAPGDPIRALLGQHFNPTVYALLRHKYGLDQPWYQQYGTFAFILCSNGNWAIKYIGFHTEDFSIFLNEQRRSGHITIKTAVTLFVEFRSTAQHVYINKQLITSYGASDLKPTILFSNNNGPVLYSNFSFVPITQQ